ncbi:MAG: MATE family efflux transporter [Eubacterium sp.]|nr:MATE family efflux transporter [Eubacterium sp.]
MEQSMTQGPIRKQIILFTLPIMLSIFLQQFYSMVDSIIVGNYVGELALAAVGTNVPAVGLFTGVAIGMTTGCSIVASQLFGAKKGDDVKKAVASSLILNIILGIVVTFIAEVLAGVFFKYVLNAEGELLENAVLYFRIYCIALVFQFLYNTVTNLLRSVGDSKAGLYFLLISSGMNIVLDLVFVIVLKTGIAGAAVATVISQAVAGIVSLIYMETKHEALKVSLSELKYDREIGSLAIKFGIPVIIQQCAIYLGQIVVQRLVNTFGMTAGYAAAIRVENIVLIPVFAFNAGMSMFAGQNVGAGEWKRVSDGLKNIVGIGFGICALLSIVTFVFSRPLISLFGVTDDAMWAGYGYLHFCSCVFWIFCVYMIINAVMQGAGDVTFTMFNSFSGLVIRCAVAYVMAYFLGFGGSAVWVSVPISWGYSLILSLFRYRSGKWKEKAVAARRG